MWRHLTWSIFIHSDLQVFKTAHKTFCSSLYPLPVYLLHLKGFYLCLIYIYICIPWTPLYPRRPEEGTGSSRTEVREGCQPARPARGAENWLQLVWKSSQPVFLIVVFSFHFCQFNEQEVLSMFFVQILSDSFPNSALMYHVTGNGIHNGATMLMRGYLVAMWPLFFPIAGEGPTERITLTTTRTSATNRLCF